jgi:hypothetical protein
MLVGFSMVSFVAAWLLLDGVEAQLQPTDPVTVCANGTYSSTGARALIVQRDIIVWTQYPRRAREAPINR